MRAIVVQSAFERLQFCTNYDLVVPPILGPPGGDVWQECALMVPARRTYLLTFQGELRPLDKTVQPHPLDLILDHLEAVSKNATQDKFLLQFQCIPATEQSDDDAFMDWALCGADLSRKTILKKSEILDIYISRVDENAPQGTALAFIDPYIPRVYDDDNDKNGIFSLTLINNNGTFEISPNVVERSTSFILRVRDNFLLDYELRHSVQLKILAQEIGPHTNLSNTVNVTVYINDVNDNPPVFDQLSYIVLLPENMTLGTKIVQVRAEDVDSAGSNGLIRYTAILGYLNTSLNLDAESGLITLATNNHGFDRETMPEYHLYVEARDDNGNGNRAQVPLVIQLLDVNDEIPTFEKNLYEFILAPDLESFTSTACIHASDKDATRPNNEVRYEVINGNYDNKFHLEKITGVLSVRDKIILRKRRQTKFSSDGDFFLLTARAYDLGVPILSSTTNIRIYPPESRIRTVTFVVPGRNPDKSKTEEILTTITGGRVVIHNITPLKPDELNAENISGRSGNPFQSSIVTATVLYDSSSIVDISQIQQRLSRTNSSYAILIGDDTAETSTLYKDENKLLFWILILLASLVALMALILLLCCIFSWCPLYGASSKKIVDANRTKDGVHLVHSEMTNGKQAKSVQVAEWMGRREAWSAEKPSEAVTKSTRWEFYNGCKELSENLRISSGFNNEESKARIHSADHRIVKKRTTEDATLHTSKTNLINDRDVGIEDLPDDRELFYIDKNHIQCSHLNLQFDQRSDNRVKRADDCSKCNSDMVYSEYDATKNKEETFIKDGGIEILNLITRDKTTGGLSATGDNRNLYVNIPIKPEDFPNSHLIMINKNGKQIIREHYQIIPGPTKIQLMPNEIEQQSSVNGDTISLCKSVPNSLEYSYTEPDVKVICTQNVNKAVPIQTTDQPSTSNQILTHKIEASLKRQNELLRKILMEKERLETRYPQKEVILETQSLPGLSVAIGTQTECEVGTQIDSNFNLQPKALKNGQGKFSKRKARSENDDSMSEDEYEYVRIITSSSPEGIYLMKRKKQKNCSKYRGNKQRRRFFNGNRKIRTPIKEESAECIENRRQIPPQKPLLRQAETKIDSLGSKEFAHKRSTEKKYENSYKMHIKCEQSNEKSKKRKIGGSSFEIDVLPEAELNIKNKTNVQRDKDLKKVSNLHDTHKEKSSSLQILNKNHLERCATSQAEKVRVYQSEMELNYQGDRRNDKEFVIKKVPKYMEWYFGKQGTVNIKGVTNNSKPLTSKKKNNVVEMGLSRARLCSKPEYANFSPENKVKRLKGLLKEDIEINKQFKPKFETETSHPLLQHSEYRFERDNVPVIQVPSTNLPHHMYLEKPNQSHKENEVEEKLAPANATNANIPKMHQHLNAACLEDDHDSGIVMNSVFTNVIRRNPIADKKSIFSIAYDDVNGVRKIASGEESPEFS